MKNKIKIEIEVWMCIIIFFTSFIGIWTIIYTITNKLFDDTMTPTEQDKELREKLYSLLKTDPRADTYVIPYRVMDIIVDFIPPTGSVWR